jgi:hypothetical protein
MDAIFSLDICVISSRSVQVKVDGEIAKAILLLVNLCMIRYVLIVHNFLQSQETNK